MPVVGIGLNFLFAIYFAIHAVRSGQQLYWLVILFMFPGLGSLVYFVVIYLPDSRLQTGARRVASVAARTLDPTRELREAKAAFDFTPTAQNQMRLAAAQLEAGDAEAAANNYEACLKGPFASDMEIQFRAAQAFMASGRTARAIERLLAMRAADAGFRPEQLGLLLAKAYAADGRRDDAAREFEAARRIHGSFEVCAEYEIFAWNTGDVARAQELRAELDPTIARWTRHTRTLNAELLRRLDAARARQGRA